MTLRRRGAEQGFTLVELLVVMVILPLVAGAIAVAIITTEKNAGTTTTRLTDSANAQISSEYYIPDVQSAQFVTIPKPETTQPGVTTPYTATASHRYAGPAPAPPSCSASTGRQRRRAATCRSATG